MEEDIKILEEFIGSYKIGIRQRVNRNILNCIENLIERTKELEELQDYYIDKIKRYENKINTYLDKIDKIYKDSNYETLLKDFEKSGNHIPKL